MELEKMIKEVEDVLSPKRFRHSLGVMKRMEELAKQYNVDIETAQKIGITHDMAKEMTDEEMLKYAQDHHIEVDEIEKEIPSLLHGKIAADMTKKRYHFTIEMQKAICYHTTGNPHMDLLAKLLFIADKTEENRKYIDLEKEKALANTNLNLSMISLLDESLRYTIQKGSFIHPDSIMTRNALLKEIKVTKEK